MPTFHERRLPHFHAIGQSVFLTWRLNGSLPANRHFPTPITAGQAFVAMDRLLDNAVTVPLYLKRPEMAEFVVDAIRYQDGRHYDLHAFVVMANHVHLLITPLVEVPTLTRSLKRFTARKGNLILGVVGRPFWQDESYDRMVRNDTEFQNIARYIEWNPVKAGIVVTPEDFLWSSASEFTHLPHKAAGA